MKIFNTAIKNNFSSIIRNNYLTIISIFVILLLIFGFYQFYNYSKQHNILKLSISYDEAVNTNNSEEFLKKMKLISKEEGIIAIFASLDLIMKSIEDKDYDFAYEQYLKLLKNNKSNTVYNSILAIHGSYNLIDYLPSDKILFFLNFVDESKSPFSGYKSEIQYLISIKDENFIRSSEISDIILNNEEISPNIKKRIKKINEYYKYQ